MSMRYEGNVIIKGSQEVVEVFIQILVWSVTHLIGEQIVSIEEGQRVRQSEKTIREILI